MDAEVKSKWVAALRSGEYKQGRGKLYDKAEDTYCCLGVLHVVKGRAILENVTSVEEDPYRWLDDEIGAGNTGTLVSMNDGRGESFREIAKWIGENL